MTVKIMDLSNLFTLCTNPNFKPSDVFKKPYTKKAKELIDADKSEAIKIDHLAFSFKLSQLRHCSKAGFGITSKKGQSHFPAIPKIESYKSESGQSFQDYQTQVHHTLMNFYESTLVTFTDFVLGMQLGLTTGKGFHGYKDSMPLKANGVQVGLVGIGGQRDTVYFQISGEGCKHLFQHITYFNLHHWLNKVLDITTLSRVDLCYDDFDGIYDCDHAVKAHCDGWFKTNPNCRQAKIDGYVTWDTSSSTPHQITKMVTIGSRTSAIYWRIYDKKLEQFEKNEEELDLMHWYRSEVELKKWSTDVLLNVSAAFAGLCPYAKECANHQGVKTKQRKKVNDACAELASRVRHVRRQCGKALNDILDICGGDLYEAFGLIVPDDTAYKYGIPPTHKQLIKQVIGA